MRLGIFSFYYKINYRIDFLKSVMVGHETNMVPKKVKQHTELPIYSHLFIFKKYYIHWSIVCAVYINKLK
jgi:DNA modification methylase